MAWPSTQGRSARSGPPGGPPEGFASRTQLVLVDVVWTEAAELGSIDALYNLGFAYYFVDGVQKDKKKVIGFWSKAAVQGHVESRYRLGCYEGMVAGNYGRAVKHLLISAKMGHEKSVEEIKRMLMGELVKKEHYAQALKGHQDAVEEMRSPERDEAKSCLGGTSSRRELKR